MPNRSVNFTIGANISKLQKNLGKAQKRFKRFGYKMERIGSNMTRNISTPLAIAGGASLKLASDFESSMTKIQTLVGLSAESVDIMKDSVIALSNQTGRSANELSEALFTVTSAGLRGEKALSVLEKSAKASAVGLGTTKEIAKATTSVLQAYGKENITASRATDTLLKTVRAGNLEASELAPALGRVLGVASTLGVSFEEIGANVATFTRLGVSSEEAVTGLRSAMNAFIKPSKQAKDTLADVGLSMEGMRDKIRQDGLANALQFLVGKFDGNVEALGKVIPNVRALSNVLGTAGAQGETYAGIVDQIKNSTDGLGEAFDEASKNPAQKFNRALEKVKNQGIDLGRKLFPVAEKIIGMVSDMADTFASFSDDTKENILKVAGVLAVGGPLLIAIGKVSKGISSLIGGFKNLIKFGKVLYVTVLPKIKTALVALATTAKAHPILAIASALAAVGTAAYFARQDTNEFKKSVEEILSTNPYKASEDTVNAALQEAQKYVKGFRDLEEKYGLGKREQKRLEYWEGVTAALKGYRNQVTMLKFEESLKGESEQSVKIKPEVEDSSSVATSVQSFDNDIGMNKTLSPVPDISDPVNKYTSNLQKMKASTMKAKETLTQFQKDLANNLAPVIKNGLTDIGTSFLENAVKVGIAGDSIGGAFKSLLSGLADLAIRVGKIAIATGVAIEGIRSALSSLNPVAAIVAGGALIALGAGVKSALANAPNRSSGSGGGSLSGSVQPSGPSLTDRDAQRVYLSNISNQSQYSMQKAFERALANAQLKANGSDLQLVLNNSGYTNR